MKKKINGVPDWTDVVLTRLFNASRQELFRAWTDEAEVAQWWGPHGFTNPVCNWSARPLGAIYIDMTAPDGVVFPMTGVFHELAPPERVVFTSRAFESEPGSPQLEVLNTVIFTEVNGRTKLTLEATVMKAAPGVAESLEGMHEGWQQSLDKLDKHIQRIHKQ
ncbi:MAG: hypothetical protein K0Q66_664 [Chitinophagaceae bacterium]|nr:hypothetical protein [Chitinophagaceae bacterium]